METEPLEEIDEHASGETPEDVAILYSWANLQGAKYRDFSANRREYRAQMRHRAAEQLRMMELRAQSEAEAAASQAEAESAAAHAEADAASVKLAASRAMPAMAPEEILEEKEVEQLRRASLREAAQQARRAAAERLEAARRAEAAALADSIARREEREIAEAQASALRQATQYHDSEMKSRQMKALHPEDQVPGHLNDPYSPQILAEGEYYDGPGTPPSELQASRFRMQREYIEKATGTELPPFKMPTNFNEDGQQHRFDAADRPAEFVSGDRPGDYARAPEPRHPVRGSVRDAGRAVGRDAARNVGPRRIADMDPQDRNYPMERHLREDRNAATAYGRDGDVFDPRDGRSETGADRFGVPSTSYSESYRNGSEPARSAKAEVVSRIPDARRDAAWERDEYRYDQERERPQVRQQAEQQAGRQARPREERQGDERPDRRQDFEPELRRERRPNSEYDGSLLSTDAGRSTRRESERGPGAVEPWMYERNGRRPLSADMRDAGAQQSVPQARMEMLASNERADLFEDRQPYPAAPSPMPRPSGSWLQRISGGDWQTEKQNEPRSGNDRRTSRPDPPSKRPSVEATYADGLTDEALTNTESHPSGFRPPWLTQAQAPRPSGSRNATQSQGVPDEQKPQWLYAEPSMPEATVSHSVPQSAPAAVPQKGSSQTEVKPGYLAEQKVETPPASQASTLQGSQEAVASRWFALKGVFERPEAMERQVPREKNRAASAPVPTIAVFSLAGGVGKTSLVATLGRALSSLGEKVLLADTTSHGLLPFYFGAKELHPGVVRTFAPPSGSTDATVHMVSYGPETSNGGGDAQRNIPDGQRKIIDELLASSKQVNRVLIDVSHNCTWIVEKLAGSKPMVLVPLAADMNSIISLQAVEKIFSAMRDADGAPLRPVYLMNQFDASLPLHLDVREVLRQQLGDRLLPLAVRHAGGVSEALAEGMTIVDYDPDSPAAQDFVGLANWIRAVSAPAAAGFRNLRWSER